MPELPEVETTRRGILPHIKGQVIENIEVRQSKLRWPVPTKALQKALPLMVNDVRRRAKYLLIETASGNIIIHLGMSGRLSIVPIDTPAGIHDHVDLQLANGFSLRLTDPRRFGAVLWTTDDPNQHKLFRHLGPEPLSIDFSGKYLHHCAAQRKKTVKEFIMDQAVVVGVGNIYAVEALFAAKINPKRAAGKISLARYQILVEKIKVILQAAIKQGGTTLKDFLGGDGQPGYFAQQLAVYGREGEACTTCKGTIVNVRLGNRASCYCPRCQR